ncbi:ImmA/IrrE family metallo-endopeptidase [Levilactobacillus lanxiensis]|uniref:ImmA/IrrE family metallo-endopeptidase n=1 Tax=Levilactobacillus lanxiensis TaxID=2799568 RepID=A0ABW4D055_9LACO|nr:ImmA/IrrE family metallo-endopeptidase [Levilactobacillus lanxiensis]
MDSSTRQTIDELAELLHKEIFAEHSDYRNVDSYLEAEGIDVKYILTEEFDGYLRWDGQSNRPVIAVSALNVPVRQNFTKAHELGHLILHWKWLPDMTQVELADFKQDQVLEVSYRGKADYTVQEQIRETQANEFAAAFLIPNYKLTETVELAAQAHDTLPQLVKRIAKTYFVAEMTAKIRLQNYRRLLLDGK